MQNNRETLIEKIKIIKDTREYLLSCDAEPTLEKIKDNLSKMIKNLQSHIGVEAHQHSINNSVEFSNDYNQEEYDRIILKQIKDYEACLKIINENPTLISEILRANTKKFAIAIECDGDVDVEVIEKLIKDMLENKVNCTDFSFEIQQS